MTARALVLFAHGARDARWREPFDRLQKRLAAQQPDVDVRLAFLELMTPDLPGTIDELAAAGVQHITIVPVFFGQGGHLRRDLPALVERCAQAHPALVAPMLSARTTPCSTPSPATARGNSAELVPLLRFCRLHEARVHVVPHMETVGVELL